MTIRQGKAGHVVTEVVLHTSATERSWPIGKTADQMRDEIRQWHVRDRGWRDIGYHILFAPLGQMARGRSLYEIGAGVQGHNRGVIHICLVPSHRVDRIGKFEDFYTSHQRVALRDYLLELEELAGVNLKVTGHNDYANKLCPGFKVVTEDWL